MIGLQHWKEKAAKLNILLIGDALLDVYVHGQQNRFCREAPLPIFSVTHQSLHGGGAANTAINLTALGANTCFISAIGNDQHSMELIELLQQHEVNSTPFVIEEGRRLATKKRYLADNTILFRADEGDSNPIRHHTEYMLIDRMALYWETADLILIADYSTGLLTKKIILAIEQLQQKSPKKILVDAHHPARFASLKPYLVKPNYHESIQTLSLDPVANEARIDQLKKHQHSLFQQLGTSIICQTLDKNGVLLLQQDKDAIQLNATPMEERKAIGAGDSFMATLTIAIGINQSVEQAVEWSNTAAQIVLKKEKTAICSAEELWTQLDPLRKYHKDIHAFVHLIEEEKKSGKTIVFTNGCFDILHKGHIAFLEKARQLGDMLIVAVNTDHSIQQLKGNSRPVNTLADRIAVLSALTYVDHIISFNSLTAEQLIYTLKPSVFVKGSSYINRSIPETEAIKKTGGKICILRSSSYSTSAIINRIQNRV